MSGAGSPPGPHGDRSTEPGGSILVFDTATTLAVVGLGTTDARLVAQTSWSAGYRHGEELLARIDGVLAGAGVGLGDLRGIVVGTGPGAFTGLRVGLATAKGLAHGLGIPIVGVPTGVALAAAAIVADPTTPPPAGLLPAGPADRILVDPQGRASLVPAGTEPTLDAHWRLFALDLPDRAPADALARGIAHPGPSRAGAAPDRRGPPAGWVAVRSRHARARVRHAAPRRAPDDRIGGMVARPELSVNVTPMELADVTSVEAIEEASFSAPWPPNAYRTELQSNRLAHYMVIRVGSRIVGYAGLWLMVDEAHVTTFAIHPDWRRRRLGERLLLALLDARSSDGRPRRPSRSGCRTWPPGGCTRSSASCPVGIRPRYYTDNNEDALIMTTDRLDGPPMTERLARLRATIAAAPESVDGPIPADPAAAEQSASDATSGPQPPPRRSGRRTDRRS